MLRFFKIITVVEGISLLLLFFVAMPMKYAFDRPEYVKYAGWAHGLLFSLYIVLALMLKIERDWSTKKLTIIALASVLPLGFVYIDRKLLSEEK
jgi:integral membrane protein